MTTRLTLFTATLVQDSALSVSGLDRESSTDQPFAVVDGVPILVGRGLKGAAVAMARRFFDPLPRSVSEEPERHSALRRSAWEFADAAPVDWTTPRIRAGMGIRHKTGARAKGVLYDREVIPAGTKWALTFRVDWSHAEIAGAVEAEGILGYILAQHWAQARCWLGGGAARGLGWCHIENLRTYRLDEVEYDRWVESGRAQLPPPLNEVPRVEPTRSWCFRTLDVDVTFGEYRPEPSEPAWGLDMLAIGPHGSERAVQPAGDGTWARPSWAPASAPTPDTLNTDRAILMEGARPLLPGSSLRGPMRHAFSRAERALGRAVQDPHEVQGAVEADEPGGQAFGSVAMSSRILIRDGRAGEEWAAARLHMHAEDEFSAGSYGSAKRDAVRVLRGTFPTRIVVEGPTPDKVRPLTSAIDRLVALGALGHLPVGGHKTRGAGWGHWQARGWAVEDVEKARSWTPPSETEPNPPGPPRTSSSEHPSRSGRSTVRVTHGSLPHASLTLGEAARLAQKALGDSPLVAWWCDPAIDLARVNPPATFGRQWPLEEHVQVDEVAFFAERSVWRAARTVTGARWVFINENEEVQTDASARRVDVVHTSAKLHGFTRFSAADIGKGTVLICEWHVGDELLGFTITKESR
jgi:CRISPR/Cas system CSM-associated protein Csm3 (group 7 of RAMP superfamily)